MKQNVKRKIGNRGAVMKTVYNKKSMQWIIGVSVLSGVVIGSVLFLYMMLKNIGIDEISISHFSIKGVCSLPSGKLIVILLKKRITQLLFLFIMLKVFSYWVVLGGYGLFFGGYYGYIMSGLFYQYGFYGTVYGIACFFPHYLCYAIAFYLVGKWFFYLSERDLLSENSVKIPQYFLKFFVIFLLLFLGLFWEINFQKNILKIFTNI